MLLTNDIYEVMFNEVLDSEYVSVDHSRDLEQKISERIDSDAPEMRPNIPLRHRKTKPDLSDSMIYQTWLKTWNFYRHLLHPDYLCSISLTYCKLASISQRYQSTKSNRQNPKFSTKSGIC